MEVETLVKNSMPIVIYKLKCITPDIFNVREIPTHHLLFISYAQIVILPT